MVVDDDDAQRSHGSTAGRRTWTWVPCGTWAVIVIDPPSSTARSRMATSPIPGGVSGARPTPSSTTSISTALPAAILSHHVVAAAWRTTLVTASVTMR